MVLKFYQVQWIAILSHRFSEKVLCLGTLGSYSVYSDIRSAPALRYSIYQFNLAVLVTHVCSSSLQD